MRIKDGEIKKGTRIKFMSTGTSYQVERVGVFTPKRLDVDALKPGELGFVTASIKAVADTSVGDTLTDDLGPAAEPLPGFKPSIPVVWCGLFPVDAAQFELLRDSLAKLRLNDASFHYAMESKRGAGLRLPLRIPRSSPYGDHSGTLGARVRSRSDHHGASLSSIAYTPPTAI